MKHSGNCSPLGHPIDIIASFEKIQHPLADVLSLRILLPFFCQTRRWWSLERRPFDFQRAGVFGCGCVGNVGDLPA